MWRTEYDNLRKNYRSSFFFLAENIESCEHWNKMPDENINRQEMFIKFEEIKQLWGLNSLKK